MARPRLLSWTDFPPDFPVWKLNPRGADLEIKEMAAGVYALLSTIPGVDNAGFVVGEKGILVVDAHISLPMARRIQERIREVSDKPLLYLANTNYHGDHTFGNCAFPATTALIQQAETASRTPYVEEEKEFLLPAVGNDAGVFAGVSYRPPDLIFSDFLKVDLGGKIVELHWFGPANTPGDTVVYVPDAGVAWTGNMTGGSFGLALESDAPTFLETLTRLTMTIAPRTLVPGHSAPLDASVLGLYMLYFSRLTAAVKRAIEEGWGLQESIERIPMAEEFCLPSGDPRAPFMEGRHRYNVHRTYLSLTGGLDAPSS